MMMRRLAIVLCCAALVAGAAACSSGDDSSSQQTTTTSNKGFQIETPDGQVSVNLSGELPPNWPDDFPVPDGAEPAGSGSLGNSSSTGFIGVFTTSESNQDTYAFYENNSAYTVTDTRSVGVGSSYLGTVQFTGDFGGWVVVAPYNGGSIILAYVSQSTTSGTTTGATSATVNASPSASGA